VIEDQLLEEFRRQFADEIVRSLEEVGDDTPIRMDVAVFTAAAGDLQETGVITGYDLCAYEDQSGRDRVRIVGYQLEDDATRLDLFTAVHVPEDAPGYLPDKDVEKALSWCARFFKHAAKGDFKRFESNVEALAAAKRIHKELSSIEEVRVHLVTNSLVRNRGTEAVEVEGRPVEFSIWDFERLHRARAEEITRDRIEVDFQELTGRPLACVEMKPQPQDYQTFLTVLPGYSRLNVQIRHLQRIPDNEVPPWFNHVAHKRREDLRRVLDIADPHLQQRPDLRVERSLPKLFGVHLAQALEALNRKALAALGQDAVEGGGRAGDTDFGSVQR